MFGIFFSIIKELILMQFIYSFIFILYIFLSFFLIKLIYKDNLIIEENLTKIIESKNKFYCIINISNLIVLFILLLLSIKIFKYTYISIFISIIVNIIYIYYKTDSIYLRMKSKWLK